MWCRSALYVVAICGCGRSPDATPSVDAVTPSEHRIAYVSGYGPDIRRYDIGDDGSLEAIGRTQAFAAFAIDRQTGMPTAIAQPVVVTSPAFVGITALLH
jgi:hypothetical protein